MTLLICCNIVAHHKFLTVCFCPAEERISQSHYCFEGRYPLSIVPYFVVFEHQSSGSLPLKMADTISNRARSYVEPSLFLLVAIYGSCAFQPFTICLLRISRWTSRTSGNGSLPKSPARSVQSVEISTEDVWPILVENG